jgi:recombination protein RecT
MPGTTVVQAVADNENRHSEKSDAAKRLEAVTDLVVKQYDTFAVVMPDGLNRDRFNNLVTTLVRRSPDLINCVATTEGRTSLALAAIQCAALGLEPNTPLREASIVPRKNKGNQEAQLMVEYRGLIKLARRSGELSTISAEVVHERDAFEYSLGLEPTLRHEPYDGDDDPGELTHCYAVAKFKDGGVQFVVLPRREVHNFHRSKSDSWRSDKSRPYSLWTTNTEAMWKKTAIRALEPFLPLTADAQRGLIAAGDGVTLRMEGNEIVAPDYVGHIAYDRDDAIDTRALEPPGDVDAATGEITNETGTLLPPDDAA